MSTGDRQSNVGIALQGFPKTQFQDSTPVALGRRTVARSKGRARIGDALKIGRLCYAVQSKEEVVVVVVTILWTMAREEKRGHVF